VPYIKRGRYGVVHGCIEKLFQPSHMSMETNTRDDFSTDVIMTKVRNIPHSKLEGSIKIFSFKS